MENLMRFLTAKLKMNPQKSAVAWHGQGNGSFWASASQGIANRNGGSRRKRCCGSRSGFGNGRDGRGVSASNGGSKNWPGT
jgi:hypothetical protein